MIRFLLVVARRGKDGPPDESTYVPWFSRSSVPPSPLTLALTGAPRKTGLPWPQPIPTQHLWYSQRMPPSLASPTPTGPSSGTCGGTHSHSPRIPSFDSTGQNCNVTNLARSSSWPEMAPSVARPQRAPAPCLRYDLLPHAHRRMLQRSGAHPFGRTDASRLECARQLVDGIADHAR